MPWVDDQRGNWVWEGPKPIGKGGYSLPAKPSSPPPSAARSNANVAPPPAYGGLINGQTQEEILAADPAGNAARTTSLQERIKQDRYNELSPGDKLKVDLYRQADESSADLAGARDDVLGLADEFLTRMNPPTAPAYPTADPATAARYGAMSGASTGRFAGGATAPTLYGDVGPIAPRDPSLFRPPNPSGAPGAPGATAPTPAPPGGVDQSSLDPYRAERAAALADQRRVLDSILSLDAPAPMTEAERRQLRSEYSDLALSAANSRAMSTPGGAASRVEASIAANQQMPALQGEAARQARAEAMALERERLDRYLGDVQRLGVAGGVANTIGQTATNAFGQEAGLATTDAELGVRVWEGLMKDSGLDKQLAQMDRQLALDTQKFIGSMVLDLQRLGFDYSKLSAEQEMALFDNLVQIYGIDTQAATAIKVAAKNKERDVLDWISGIAGAVDSIGGVATKAMSGGAAP